MGGWVNSRTTDGSIRALHPADPSSNISSPVNFLMIFLDLNGEFLDCKCIQNTQKKLTPKIAHGRAKLYKEGQVVNFLTDP